MCGRYSLRRSQLARAVFEALSTTLFDEFTERPRFNIAPSQDVPLVRLNSNEERILGLARWGLIPSWAKDSPKTKPINARAETVATSGMFKQSFARRRCLIPADGFFEWKGDKPPKQPYFIHWKDDRLFAFAGIWERWTQEGTSKSIDTFAIVTTSPNEVMRPIHNRMPAILRPSDYAAWLRRDTPIETAVSLLHSYDSQDMEAHPVSSKVNSPRHDSPDCVEPAGTIEA